MGESGKGRIVIDEGDLIPIDSTFAVWVEELEETIDTLTEELPPETRVALEAVQNLADDYGDISKVGIPIPDIATALCLGHIMGIRRAYQGLQDLVFGMAEKPDNSPEVTSHW